MSNRNGPDVKPIPGDPSDPAGLTALLHRHLQWLETHNYAVNTVKIRRLQLSRFIQWCLERTVTRAAELTPELLERYQRHLFYYRKKNGEPLSISSQSHWLTALRSWMAWLKKQKVLEHNPAEELQLPKEEKRLPRHILTQQEVESILEQPNLDTLCGLRLRAILELFYSSGLRRMEVLNLELGDIDRQRGVILVRNGKGNKDRFVPLGERTVAWLDKYLQDARPQLCNDPEQALLFVSKSGSKLHANFITSRGTQDDEPGGHYQKGILPSLQTYGRLLHAGRRGRRTPCAGNSRSRESELDSNLHTCVDRQAVRGAPAYASLPAAARHVAPAPPVPPRPLSSMALALPLRTAVLPMALSLDREAQSQLTPRPAPPSSG